MVTAGRVDHASLQSTSDAIHDSQACLCCAWISVFDESGNVALRFVAEQVFTVERKKAATFMVEFAPQEMGSYSHDLHLRVNNNPFEQYKVAVAGTVQTA